MEKWSFDSDEIDKSSSPIDKSKVSPGTEFIEIQSDKEEEEEQKKAGKKSMFE